MLTNVEYKWRVESVHSFNSSGYMNFFIIKSWGTLLKCKIKFCSQRQTSLKEFMNSRLRITGKSNHLPCFILYVYLSYNTVLQLCKISSRENWMKGTWDLPIQFSANPLNLSLFKTNKQTHNNKKTHYRSAVLISSTLSTSLICSLSPSQNQSDKRHAFLKKSLSKS